MVQISIDPSGTLTFEFHQLILCKRTAEYDLFDDKSTFFVWQRARLRGRSGAQLVLLQQCVTTGDQWERALHRLRGRWDQHGPVSVSNHRHPSQWRIQDSPGGGGSTYDFAKISRKLHEKSKEFRRRGGVSALPWIRQWFPFPFLTFREFHAKCLMQLNSLSSWPFV